MLLMQKPELVQSITLTYQENEVFEINGAIISNRIYHRDCRSAANICACRCWAVFLSRSSLSSPRSLLETSPPVLSLLLENHRPANKRDFFLTPVITNRKHIAFILVGLQVIYLKMAHLEVKRKKRSLWWLWLILIIIIAAAAIYFYQESHGSAPVVATGDTTKTTTADTTKMTTGDTTHVKTTDTTAVHLAK